MVHTTCITHTHTADLPKRLNADCRTPRIVWFVLKKTSTELYSCTQSDTFSCCCCYRSALFNWLWIVHTNAVSVRACVRVCVYASLALHTCISASVYDYLCKMSALQSVRTYVEINLHTARMDEFFFYCYTAHNICFNIQMCVVVRAFVRFSSISVAVSKPSPNAKSNHMYA